MKSLGRKKCDYVFGSSTTFQRRKEWICESRCRQVSVRLRVFAGFFYPYTLPRLQFMLGLHFTPACVLLLVCSLHFTHSLHFTPGPQSAVRSPQSAVSSLRFTLTGKIFSTETNINSQSLPSLSSSEQYSSPTVF